MEQSQQCPHWHALQLSLSLEALNSRFREHRLQEQIAQESCTCLACNERIPLQEAWACLECVRPEDIYCSQDGKGHVIEHYNAMKHALWMNIKTRVVRCINCRLTISEPEVEPAEAGLVTLEQLQAALSAPESEAEEPSLRGLAASPSPREEEEKENPCLRYLRNPAGGLAGLANLGNTCYLNASLQALLHCPPLIAMCADMDFVESDQLTARQCLVNDMADLIRKVWGGKYAVCAPRELLRDIWAVNAYFRGYGQHDSQELLRCLLDNLHEALKHVCEYDYIAPPLEQTAEQKQSVPPSASADSLASAASANSTTSDSSDSSDATDSSDGSDGSSEEKPKKPKKRPTLRESSVILDLFQGTLVSTITCSACGNLSVSEEPFLDLSLEVPKDAQLKRVSQERGVDVTPQKVGWLSSVLNWMGIISVPLPLETCLHSFCTSDQLIKKDQYRCDKCKTKVDATKSLSIKELPEILSIHIKRFSHNSYYSSKITRRVTFPLENLDLKPFMTPPDHPANKNRRVPMEQNTLYDLCAVVKHSGGVSGGHYVAYAKHHLSGRWYRFDDRSVEEVSEERVREQEAYVLFYTRKPLPGKAEQIRREIKQAEVDDGSGRCYISKAWIRKATTLNATSIPVDNRDLCCPHGVPYPIEGRDFRGWAVEVSRSGWQRLIAKYGGGPFVDRERRVCAACEPVRLRKEELSRISQLDQAALAAAKPGDPYFIIHDSWLRQWRAYVKDGRPRPGPITNYELLQEDGTPKPGLQRVIDYRGLQECVWLALHSIYGGGPAIVRATLDIYGPAVDWRPPENYVPPVPPPRSAAPSPSPAPSSPPPSAASPSPSPSMPASSPSPSPADPVSSPDTQQRLATSQSAHEAFSYLTPQPAQLQSTEGGPPQSSNGNTGSDAGS